MNFFAEPRATYYRQQMDKIKSSAFGNSLYVKSLLSFNVITNAVELVKA
jgi:hypothetical protein